MKHHHVGPLDRACTGCYQELRDEERLEEELARQEFWGRVVTAFWALVLLGLALVFVWLLSRILSS